MLTVGLGELIGAVAVLVGAAWALLTLLFRQFEKRLDEKFEAFSLAATTEKHNLDDKFKNLDDKFKNYSDQLTKIDYFALELKRLENDILRRDSIVVTRSEFEKTSEKIFKLLEVISEKVTNQAIAHARRGTD